jgi:signal peptidase I
MIKPQQVSQGCILLLLVYATTTSRPGWSDYLPTDRSLYSESFCLKIFEEVAEKARSSTWKISDRDRHILTQCRTKFSTEIDTSASLPASAQCLDIVKTLVRDGINKVKEIELPEDRVRSLARCDEVLKYYELGSENMLPTIAPTDRIVVDRNIYKTQLPARGDIIIFRASNTPDRENPQPITKRTVGLPGETVKIADGIVYINDRPIREDYLSKQSQDRLESTIVPANSYFVLGDNRQNSENRFDRGFIVREQIEGKVIWHFGRK